jgi:hypothetical protein
MSPKERAMYQSIRTSRAAATGLAGNAKRATCANEMASRNSLAPALAIVAIAAAMLAASCGSSRASTSSSPPKPARSNIAAQFTETLKPQQVTDGGVAGTGRFTITGAATDYGTVTDYRTVKGNTAVIRRVAVGNKGTITFLITINLNTGSEPWTIESATRSYAGLHGQGTETVDNYSAMPATFALKGTVSQ